MRRFILTLSAATLIAAAAPVAAQERDLPYWASIAAEEANLRRGPGEQFPIDWIYNREGVPVKVLRRMQGWRYVEEPDGTRGWISAGLLSLERSAMVTGEDLAEMRAEPSAEATLRWNVEPGVIGLLGECSEEWCEFAVEGREGWVEVERLWGAGEP